MSLELWGSELSPFSLKVRAMLDWAEHPYAWLPADGTRRQNLRAARRIARAKRRRTAVRWPHTTDLDEYPLVPFLLGGDGAVFYDSTAIARWIDAVHPAPGGPLVPADPAAAFVASLVDEAFDEVGLYVVHHLRWVVSAGTNDAGRRLARELRRHLPPGAGPLVAHVFPRRQVRRLPYLFSVAPPGLRLPLPRGLIPPTRPGFPPTHALLEDIWARWLDAVDGVLRQRPFLLGDRFTLADASVYGALGMNLADATAAARMRARAPATVAWLDGIRDRRHVGSRGAARVPGDLGPLLRAVRQTFVPLMAQNEQAFEMARARGETRFNEAAFDAGRALWDGRLLGRPFRTVVKTFQVQVWRELCARWQALGDDDRARVCAVAGGQPLTVPGGIE